MKCNQCGLEREEDFLFCPQCGTRQEAPEVTAEEAPEVTAEVTPAVIAEEVPQDAVYISVNTAAAKILQALKHPWFLVICILQSASCILALANESFSIISILLSVFLWLTYASSRKDTADVAQLRNVSGTVYAQYVVTFVAAGLILLCGVLCMVAFQYISANPAFFEETLSSIAELDDSFYALFNALGALSGTIILVFFAVAAIVIVVLNIFSMRYIHGFAKSVYKSIESDKPEIKYANAASVWLCIFGALSGIGVLSLLGGEIVAGLSSGASGATCILSGLLIRKHFLEQ